MAKSNLIPPHGGKGLTICLLEGKEREEELKKAATLKRVDLSPREVGDLIMIGIGGFSPLTGFMTHDDWKGVCENYTMSDGIFWPIPITKSVSKEDADSISIGDEITLYDPEYDNVMATMKVTEKYDMTKEDKEFECQHVFRTTDSEHPGVKMVMEQKEVNIAGPVKVLSEGIFPTKFAGIYMRPTESRAKFEELGWKTVSALQLRNPMHRSHEFLAKIAIEVTDGLFIHSLVGRLKPGDIPAEVRVKCIDVLVKNYFVEGTVVQGGYPLDMRYAGPREALLHATFRQNYGCSHMIIGRDHAGVGNYYGMFDAQKIFDEIPEGALLCQPLKIDWTFYCHKCDGMASMRTCPHGKEDRVLLSGTMLRKMLSEGQPLPDHFGRDEVIAILREYYENLDEKVEIKLHKAATG